VRIAADYFASMHTPTAVYYVHPWMIQYYADNKHLVFPSVAEFSSMYAAICANSNISRHIVVIDDETASSHGYYDVNYFFIDMFHSFQLHADDPSSCVVSADTNTKGRGWVTYYTVDARCACAATVPTQ